MSQPSARARRLQLWSATLLAGLGLSACTEDEPAPAFVIPEHEPRADGFAEYGGHLHRPFVGTCALAPRSARHVENTGCTSDLECGDTDRDYCELRSGSAVPDHGYCVTACFEDAECAQGEICACGARFGQCVPASCTTDAECTGLAKCLSFNRYQSDCTGTPIEIVGFACQTSDDRCTLDSHCQGSSLCDPEFGVRACRSASCDVGRPFVVAGEHRLAPAASRTDWLADLPSPALDGIPGGLRTRLAAHWTEIGLMEHASVAAFARSALQLMQLGAPPELLVETHAAAQDETEHARLCFALATHYAGAPVGPGPLALEGAFEPIGLVDILALVIEEGCIGETTAALEAAESADRAADPVVAQVLRQIAADEQRHAALAWKTLQWALAEGGADLRAALVDAMHRMLRDALAAAPRDERDPDATALLAHGVFTDARRERVRRDVAAEVVWPVFRALMADTAHVLAV